MPDPFVLVARDALEDAGSGDAIALEDDTAHHLRTVLRLRPDDQVIVSDGRGRSAAARLAAQGAVLVEGPRRHPAPSPALRLLQGLPKGRKIDEVVRAVTELGVDHITPVATARAVRRLEGDKRQREHGRWLGVARAACEQARRRWVPTVDLLQPLPEAVSGVSGPLLVADPGADAGSLRRAVDALSGSEPTVTLAVGPEGGFAPEELRRLEDTGEVVSLGDPVLRTEHAGLVFAAAVAFAVGRIG